MTSRQYTIGCWRACNAVRVRGLTTAGGPFLVISTATRDRGLHAAKPRLPASSGTQAATARARAAAGGRARQLTRRDRLRCERYCAPDARESEGYNFSFAGAGWDLCSATSVRAHRDGCETRGHRHTPGALPAADCGHHRSRCRNSQSQAVAVAAGAQQFVPPVMEQSRGDRATRRRGPLPVRAGRAGRGNTLSRVFFFVLAQRCAVHA